MKNFVINLTYKVEELPATLELGSNTIDHTIVKDKSIFFPDSDEPVNAYLRDYIYQIAETLDPNFIPSAEEEKTDLDILSKLDSSPDSIEGLIARYYLTLLLLGDKYRKEFADE